MLEVKAVSVDYSGMSILQEVSLAIGKGEIVTLIGPNGAGKTSTLNTILGILKPTKGTISFLDKDITGLPPEIVVPMGMSVIPEGRRVFSSLTSVENLKLGSVSQWNRKRMKKRIDELLDFFPALERRAKQLAGKLSGGEQQMLAIARGLMSDPKMLLLDEPSMGLAPLIIEDIFSILKKINAEGTTILLVEQNARLALDFAVRGYVLIAGEVVKSGNRDELMQDAFVQKAYLGI
ncbi:ABC transporter ATP-binding protein [bacterium]|nr:ABC transporter ATP-binding protein [bacterium]